MIKKKLIEVAMPLDAINEISGHERYIHHGHPNTLHLYWARRPLSACKAVLFGQLIDDPSSHPDKFPTLDDQKKERSRLFEMMIQLIQWKNRNNKAIFTQALNEIKASNGGKIPTIYDPFSGGGSIPLEALRMGLVSKGSDLNPIAVMIGKSMLEVPNKFVGKHGVSNELSSDLSGLADDIRFFGEKIKQNVLKKMDKNYPKHEVKNNSGTNSYTVCAYIWARTVPSPDPVFSHVDVPLASTFLLNSKTNKEVILVPIIDKEKGKISYSLKSNCSNDELLNAKKGTKAARGAEFFCILSNSAISNEYIRNQAEIGNLRNSLLAIIVESKNGKQYMLPNSEEIAAANCKRLEPLHNNKLPQKQYIGPHRYGFKDFSDLYINRQNNVIIEFTNEIKNIEREIVLKAKKIGFKEDNITLHEGGTGAQAYAEAIILYITFALSKGLDYWSSTCIWHNKNQQISHTFGRQAIPMTWDFVEANPFSNSSGNWMGFIDWVANAVENLPLNGSGEITLQDAKEVDYNENTIISTDPPYYDNIPYADISDYFYSWIYPIIKNIFPKIFNSLATPKTDELVADIIRHGSKDDAASFFLQGMTKAIKQMSLKSSSEVPTTIYYAFKQTEIEKEGVSSQGWSTFIEAIISAGYSVVGTWPIRTEMASRLRGSKSNALANSVVIVCRKKNNLLGTITRAEFIRQLKTELPKAISDLKAVNISPADIPQSSIGPGIGIFSRYQAVLENDDSHMSVKTALQLINRELGDEEGEYDSETSFSITWFEQNGFNVGDFGSANNIANAKGISVNTLVHSGVAQSSGGKFSLLDRESLEDDWNPTTDKNLTIWECCQYLIKTIENKGEFETAKLMKQMGSGRAESAKELAYTLYDIAANKRKDANEATAYNGLIASWSDLTAQSANITEGELRGDAQMKMI